MQVVLLNLQDGLISSAHRSTFFYDTVDVMSQLECRFAAALGVKGEEIGSRKNCEIVVKHPLDRTCTLCRPSIYFKNGDSSGNEICTTQIPSCYIILLQLCVKPSALARCLHLEISKIQLFFQEAHHLLQSWFQEQSRILMILPRQNTFVY